MKQAKWKTFEKNAALFLKDMYSDYSFIVLGESDSTAPDILCKKNDREIMKIEAKFLPSQSGQIVFLKEENSFVISGDTNNKIIKESHELLNFVNKNFDLYANEKCVEIKAQESLLYKWVKNMYMTKGSEWLIMSKKFEDLAQESTHLIPIKNLENYCSIKAVLRFKKSGTAYLPKKDEKNFITEAEGILGKIEIKKIDKKPIVYLAKTPSSLYIGEIFYLSAISENQFAIKKRATTNNLNILFQLELKKDICVNKEHYEEFKKLLDTL